MTPLLILAILFILAWFTGNKGLKILTALFFFAYPVIVGEVQLPGDADDVITFVGNVVKFWIEQILSSLVDYLTQQINPI